MNDLKIPGIKEDDLITINRLMDKLERKSVRNRIRADYYDMKRLARFVGSSIPEKYRRVVLVLGWSAKAVDTLVRRCRLEEFIWPDGTLGDIGYDQIWRDNLLDSEIKQGSISSLIHATSFMVVTAGGEGETKSLIHFKDAMNATGEWNHRLRRLDNLLSVVERDSENKPSKIALYLYNRTIVAERDGKSWEVEHQEHRFGMPAEPLPYRPRLGRPFGSSRISRAVMSLQDQATRSALRLEAHSDIYAIPDVWIFGTDESIFYDDHGFPNDALNTVMGNVKGIPDDDQAPSDTLARADVKQFPAASPSPHLESFKQQAQMFSGETSIPLTSLGVSDMSNPTSADSYIASREDLIAEAEGTTDDWSPYLQRTMVRSLAVANGIGWDDVPQEWWSIAPKWRSPIYLSRAQQADSGLKQLSAVPSLADTEVGLELVGLTPQQIERVRAEQRRSAGSELMARLMRQDDGDLD